MRREPGGSGVDVWLGGRVTTDWLPDSMFSVQLWSRPHCVVQLCLTSHLITGEISPDGGGWKLQVFKGKLFTLFQPGRTVLAGEARVRAKPFSQFHHNKKAAGRGEVWPGLIWGFSWRIKTFVISRGGETLSLTKPILEIQTSIRI